MSQVTIASLQTQDVRFPTSRNRDGSDAMNPFPDYSAAYSTLRTSTGEEGCAFVFTVGRGNDLQAAAIKALEPLVVGTSVDAALADLAAVHALWSTMANCAGSGCPIPSPRSRRADNT